jgi:hypothetical protein
MRDRKPTRREIFEQRQAEFVEAKKEYLAGDDTKMRVLTLGAERFVAECLSIEKSDPLAKIRAYPTGRRRKFFNPLFVTPRGLLHAFPENDADLFIDLDAAWAAIKKWGSPKARWSVAQTKLARQLKRKDYLRWLAEVKSLPEGVEYKEPRRSLEECYSIYADAGMAGLRKLYTPSHCFHLVAKFKDQGWAVATGSQLDTG